MKHALALLTVLLLAPLTALPAQASNLGPAASDSAADAFRAMHYGIFVHNVYRATQAPAGKSYQTLDEFCALFDAKAFADQMESAGVEYVIFTAWHRAMYQLGPNPALERWLPGHTSRTDVIGAVADALNAKGIRLILYAHPNDAHDLTAAEQSQAGFIKAPKGEKGPPIPRFNDFLNEVYGDLAARYRDRPNVLGFWWDNWWANGSRLDMPRLRLTVRQFMPKAITMSQWKTIPEVDFISLETYYRANEDSIDQWPIVAGNHCFPLLVDTGSQGWWTSSMKARCAVSPENLFRFVVWNAGANGPGGVGFAMSPLADGRTWSADNQPIATMARLGALIRPIRPTLTNVLTSRNWVVRNRVTAKDAPAFAATRSLDGRVEYVHVLRPPAGRTLTLPKPLDRFDSASLYRNGRPVRLAHVSDGLELTLGEGDVWDSLDTVITLSVVH
jgi:hypothetical protein